MLKFYFKLQSRRVVRWTRELGIHPLAAGLVSVIVFFALSKMIFLKIEMASWVYLMVAGSFLLSLGSRERNNQLKTVFNKSDFISLRVLENVILAIPFVLYFCYEHLFLWTLIMFPVSVILAVLTNLPTLQITIPTPFRKVPFEFIVGFRKLGWLILLTYLLLLKSLQVENYNLGIFSLIIIFLTCMSFYTKPEDEYFCWIFSMSPQEFLLKKITDALISVTLLSLPGCLTLIIFYTENIWITVAVQILGYIYLVSIVLAKYSAFPRSLNIAHSIFYGCSLLFPPLLLIIIPIFYLRAKQQLTQILGW